MVEEYKNRRKEEDAVGLLLFFKFSVQDTYHIIYRVFL